jgi:O-antigen/teichoic acid export membrane protein
LVNQTRPEPLTAQSAQTDSTAAPTSAASDAVNGLLWRNTAAIGCARVGSVVLDGMAYVLTARYFGPAEYGHYLSLLAFLNLVDLAADLTVMDITVREMSREPDRCGIWLTAGTILRMALAGIGVLAFVPYVILANPGGDLSRIAWTAALILPAGALRMPLALFRARMKMHYESGVVLATRFVNLMLFIALMQSRGSMYQFFLAILASRLLLAALGWGAAFTRFGVRPALPGDRLWRLVRESLPMGLSGSFVAVQLKADILLLARVTGAAAAGLYGAVAQLPEYSLYIPVVLSTPMLPVLSRLFAESARERFQEYYGKMFHSIVVAVIPLTVVALLMPRATVTFLFGASYAEAAGLLPILVLSIVAMWISHATAIAAVAAGLQANFIWIQSICMVTYLLLDWLLIPHWGSTAAALVRLLTTVIAPVLTGWVVQRRTRCILSAGRFRMTALAGGGMALTVFFCANMPVLIAAAMGGIVYGATLWAASRSTAVKVS